MNCHSSRHPNAIDSRRVWAHLTSGKLLVLLLAACATNPPEPALPDPDPVPEMVPDPVRPLPEVDVAPPVTPPVKPPLPDSVRAEQLIAIGRAVRADPDSLDVARAFFAQALNLDPRSQEAMWELGWTFHLLGDWDSALTAWAPLARLAPDHRGLARYVPILEMRRDRNAMNASLTAPEPETMPRAGERITVAAVGDIQMGMGWPEETQRLPPDSARDMFARVTDILRHPDVTFGNLETVLADTGASSKCRRGSGNCYAFRAPTVYARTLYDVGFDVMSTNNNHAGDFGEHGLTSTTQALNSLRISSSGPRSGIASWETRGLRIALIAFSTGDGPYRVQDITGAVRSVREAHETHDIVIVSFHGGAEGSGATRVPKRTETAFGEDRGDVYRFSRTLVDAGADLVLGHGPHVLRGMEVYRGRFIAYSLGNFAAWHGFNLRGPLGISAVLEVTLAPNGVVTEGRIHPVVLEGPGVPTPDPNRQAIAIVRELSELDFGNPVFDEHGRFVIHPPAN